MNKSTTNHPDHDEILALLPWFVNKTLDTDQRLQVMRHIESCDECQREIEFLESLTETIQSDAQSSSSIQPDVDKNFANVMSRIDAESHSSNTVTSNASMLQQKLGEFLRSFTTMSTPQLGATALACVLATVLGFQLLYQQSGDDYSVLSSSENNDAVIRLSVQTNATVSLQQFQDQVHGEVSKIGQRVHIEPQNSGAYIIVFQGNIGVAELSKLVADLQNDEYIDHVEILP